MDKIRILRIIARLNIGGPAIQSILLTDALNKDEFESMLVAGSTGKGESQMDFLLDKHNVKPAYIPELGREINPFADIISFYKVYRMMREYAPHVVHTHTAKAGFIGRLAAFLSRVPVRVHTFHGHTFYGYFNNFKNSIFVSIERLLAKITDITITISPLQYKDITERYRITIPSKCEIIPLGLNLDNYLAIAPSSKNKTAIGFKEGDIVVGTVGRITAIKNHELFLDIAKLFYDMYPMTKIKFAIIGDGELKDRMLKYKDRLRLGERVRFFGFQSDMARFYSAFDIFVLTSKNEGTPVSMIEAMASGLPVITTAVGGIPDLFSAGSRGYMVEGFDKSDFVKKIYTLSVDRALRESIGRNARQFAKDMYSKDILVEKIKWLYKDLLSKKSIVKGKAVSR